MLSLFTRNIPLTFLVLSIIINVFLLFLSNDYREDIKRLESDIANREQSLRDCQLVNQGWETSYDLLLESCKVQSEVIIGLHQDLAEERQGSGDVMREILLLPPEESSQDKQQPLPVHRGEPNEIQIPYTPPVAGLDDRLPDSLYEALQRAYNGDKASAAPNPRRTATTPL